MIKQEKNGCFAKSVKEKGNIGDDVIPVMVEHARYVVVKCKNVKIARGQGKDRL